MAKKTKLEAAVERTAALLEEHLSTLSAAGVFVHYPAHPQNLHKFTLIPILQDFFKITP